MNAVIVGCGRVGAGFAETLDRAGWNVLVIDTSSVAFDRLPATFSGTAIRGDGTDEDVLRRAGAENADLFLTLTEGDNRNVMAAQMAAETLGARRAVAKVNDPVRASAYLNLGIATICRTTMMIDALLAYLGMAAPTTAAVAEPVGAHAHADAESGGDAPATEA